MFVVTELVVFAVAKSKHQVKHKDHKTKGNQIYVYRPLTLNTELGVKTMKNIHITKKKKKKKDSILKRRGLYRLVAIPE